MNETLLRQAQAILTANQTDLFTKSNPTQHSFQHSWDTGFAAIGYAHFDVKRAIADIRQLFKGQWKNGMLPHVVFNQTQSSNYFHSPEFWATENTVVRPDNCSTSGITAPPIYGFVLWKIYEIAEDKALVKAFLKEMYPNVLAAHRYLYQQRDPLDEGLISVYHPWETPTPNSPLWDAPLGKIDLTDSDLSCWEQATLTNPKDPVTASEAYLVQILKSLHYNDDATQADCPFQIQDPLFHSLLVWSNECLIEIGQLLGENIAEIDHWNELTVHSISHKLWNEERATYNAFDVFNNAIIPCHTSSGLMPLFAGIPTYEQSETMLKTYLHAGFRGNGKEDFWLYPSYNLLAADVDYAKDSRGTVNIPLNWLLIHGLRHYNINKPAAQLRQHTLGLLKKYGFYEYFDPRKSVEKNGYGADQCSIAAAVVIDLLMEEF